MGSKTKKRKRKRKKSKATTSDGEMVIVKGTKKDSKFEHEVKMLNDPNPTSPDGRVAFDPPTFKR